MNPQNFDTLGNSTQYVSKLSPSQKSDNFEYRFRLLSHAQKMRPDSRLRVCLKTPAPQSKHIDIMTTPDSARFHGLMSCKNVHLCPICAPRVWAQRGETLKHVLDNAASLGYEVTMLTFTLSHRLTDNLRPLLNDLIAAYRKFFGGRAGQRIKDVLGYEGSVRALETRYSFVNGFHPHLHVVLVHNTPAPLTIETRKATKHKPAESMPFDLYLKTRWLDMLAKVGRGGHIDHALDISSGAASLASYVTKQSALNLELTNGAGKESYYSYTPTELLQLSLEGDSHAESAWVEYSYAIKGHKALQFSDGLLESLGVDKLEGENNALETPTGVLYARLPLDLWRAVKSHDKELRIRILRIARNESAYQLAVFLSNTLNLPFEVTRVIIPPEKTLYPDFTPHAPRPTPHAPPVMRDCDILF